MLLDLIFLFVPGGGGKNKTKKTPSRGPKKKQQVNRERKSQWQKCEGSHSLLVVQERHGFVPLVVPKGKDSLGSVTCFFVFLFFFGQVSLG